MKKRVPISPGIPAVLNKKICDGCGEYDYECRCEEPAKERDQGVEEIAERIIHTQFGIHPNQEKGFTFKGLKKHITEAIKAERQQTEIHKIANLCNITIRCEMEKKVDELQTALTRYREALGMGGK